MKRKIPFFDSFLVVFVSIIVFVSALSFKRIYDLINSSERVNRSNEVVLKLEQVFSLVKDAETAQRGFLLTRDSVFLQPYARAVPKIPVLIRELEDLTAPDPLQHKKVKELNTLILLKEAFIKKLIDSAGWENNKTANLGDGKNLMDQIREKVSEIGQAEQKLLFLRTKARDNYVSITPAFSLALILFTLLIIIISFLKIRKDKADMSRKNGELMQVKTYLQAILDSSSDIIITFDENLNYTSINNAGEKYLKRRREDLIGKDPFELFPQARDSPQHLLMLRALKGESNRIDSMRTVLDSEMKIQITFIPLFVGGKIKGILNIAKDITPLEKANETIQKTNELLALKNEELQEVNNGLLSFNYIASHDLKEPLRKIQTFGKLLVEQEGSKLSESSKYYFERMISSASRMQALIEALLDFSKTHVNHTDFVPTDLNKIMADLRKEFEEPLSAIQGTMEYTVLPTIFGVPPLISQLFANLISNSIKYSKKEEPLKIEIRSEKVDKIEVRNRLIEKEYWKISVKDNGIGFNQKYAEKAFELFQRLHASSKDYEGTGIGLTICKKLVQNHGGYIYAESEAGKGSTFTILIPVDL